MAFELRWSSREISLGDTHIKITLIDNPAAGNHSQLSSDELVRLIQDQGHKVNYQSSKKKKWKKAIEKPCDIIVISGGDGTVGKVATLLIGNRTPIAILPMGTANNIATTLGLTNRSLPDLIKGWTTARPVNFDAGLAKGPWGSQHFIEGFGIGLFAETMFKLDESKALDRSGSDNPKEVIPKVLTILNEQLKNFASKEMVVQVDGKDISGDYILLEALNVRHIGPNLDLVPGAEINDGFLDVVFVTEAQRTKLKKYLSDRIKHKKPPANLTVRRGQHLQIEWENSPTHIDDMIWPKRKDQTALRANAIDIRVEPAALVFLIPSSEKRRASKKTSVARRANKKF
jgi:diacylglycerol kinase (ATP)